MLIFLAALSLSLDGDSYSLLSSNKRYTGDWEFGGTAFISDSAELVLTSNASKATGFARFPQRLPSESWSASVTFTFAPDSPQSEFALWFTKDFGPTGHIFGGPLQFYGIGVLFLYNGSAIHLEVRENDNRGQFTSYHFFPIFETILKNSTVTAAVSYEAPTLVINVTTDGIGHTVYETQPRVRVRRTWLAITAQNGKQGFPIVVNSIKLENFPDEAAPTPPETGLVVLERVSEKGSGTIEEILSSFDELIEYMEPLANRSEAQRILTDSMLPFVEKWQRRSYAIVRSSEAVRSRLIDGLLGIAASLSEVKADINASFRELKAEVHEVESTLYFGVLKGYHIHRHIRQERKSLAKSWTVKVLLWISGAEVVAALVLVVSQVIRERS
jgi:hypothetical protein